MLRKRPLAVLSATALALSGFGALALNTTAQAAPASDLMLSVYIEGSGYNKAIELYNPTADTLSLGDYTIDLYSNGSASPTATEDLPTQELAAGEHFVVYYTDSRVSADLIELGDFASPVVNYNGDDALVLRNSGTVLDSIGQIEDRGTDGAWSANGVSTQDMTLTKQGCTVDNDPNDAYDPSVDFAATAKDDFSTLGRFTCDGLTDPDPVDPPDTVDGITAIGAVQGDGEASPLEGKIVTVQGHVVGSFQGENQFDGYYLQDAGDDNDATSDGIFVYTPNVTKVEMGTFVEVTGLVGEAFEQTQLLPTEVKTLTETATAPEATKLTVPVKDPERYEGMLVTFPNELTILEYFQYGRYGEIVLGPKRQNTPTAVVEPGPVAQALANQNESRRLIMDDGLTSQNPSPARHPNGMPFAKDNFFRGGDKLVDVAGIMSYRNGAFKLQPTKGAQYIASNPRPEVPVLDGDFTVASYNVLNYFTTFKNVDSDARGAADADEFERQQQKIVAALAAIDADVYGLIEIENNGGFAVDNLVKALNINIGSETYKAVNTGKLGSDAITQAFIYKPGTTKLSGEWAAFDFEDSKNRPVLVQTFKHKSSGETVNVSINHLKSKGSNCNSIGDPDLGDGAGNCNLTRTKAAKKLAEFMGEDPTGQQAERSIVLGDLNSYDHEDPIDALKAAGYTDLEKQFGGEYAYSYVFNGQIGYLDYAMANQAARADVTGATSWHINSDEATLLDYTLGFKAQNEQDLWEATPYRSSDHDPVIVGMQLGEVVTPEPTPAPTVTVTVPGPTVTAKPTPPTGDLYETPGFHDVNGRKWMTTCEPYSKTVRCFTYIWGTQVQYTGGQFVKVNGWFFNNLTYVAAPRSLWEGNKLAFNNSWTATDGRKWRTECETAQTGRNGCRSYAEASVIESTNSGYRQVKKFVFNNIVRFST